MTDKETRSGRVQLLLLAAIFFGPLAIAAWLYLAGEDLQPEGRTNRGALLEPIVAIGNQLPGSAINAHNEDHWLLVFADTGPCETECRDGLYTMRQSRLMLGREMERLKRVFLHGESAPDTVFLAEEHEGLIAIRDDGLAGLLASKRPGDLAGGGYFLVDPLGNLVLYFPPDIDPSDMVRDIKRLLKLSRIG